MIYVDWEKVNDEVGCTTDMSVSENMKMHDKEIIKRKKKCAVFFERVHQCSAISK